MFWTVSPHSLGSCTYVEYNETKKQDHSSLFSKLANLGLCWLTACLTGTFWLRDMDIEASLRTRTVREKMERMVSLFFCKTSFQLDELIDVSNCSQLVFLARCVKGNAIEEQLLFCNHSKQLQEQETFSSCQKTFFTTNDIPLQHIESICQAVLQL